MTSLQLYQKFHLLLNSNILFQNVRVERENFVLLFNREKDRWLSEKIDKANSTEDIFDLQSHYVVGEKLKQTKAVQNKIFYALPEQFFNLTSSYSVARKQGCTGVVVNYPVKPKDELEIVNDSFNSPSFEYEESVCNITENQLAVFFKEYTIDDTYLSYYKEIEPIDLEGYTNVEGKASTTIHPKIDNFYLEQILDRCVTETMREYKDQLGFQLSNEREKDLK